MSKLTESYRDVRVFNVANFYNSKHGQVYIAYNAADHGRGGRGASVQVMGVGFKTDPDSAWYNYDRKTFLPYNKPGTAAERRAATVAEAKAWATERYGVTEWARDPYGCWGDAAFITKRKAQLAHEIAHLIAEPMS